MIDKELLEILACPLCKTPVELKGADLLCCKKKECACRYAIEDDIPNMLIEEAQRPCPKCSTQRDWAPEEDTLRCTRCNTSFRPEAPGV